MLQNIAPSALSALSALRAAQFTCSAPVVWKEPLWGKPRPILGCCALKEERRWDWARWRGWCLGWGMRGRREGGRSWPPPRRRWSWCSAGCWLTTWTASASSSRDGAFSARPPESKDNWQNKCGIRLFTSLSIPWLFVRIPPSPRPRGFSTPRPIKHWLPW